jgi:hypothetical protein
MGQIPDLQQSASPQQPSADQTETGPAIKLKSARMATAFRIAQKYTTQPEPRPAARLLRA